MALQAAADELYGLPPEQFTAARDDFAARLRQAGERELAAAVRDLRRPSVSAWLVNSLVRRSAPDLDALLDVGDRLRSAMTSGAGHEVRILTEDRRTAVATLVADVEATAGRPVTPGVSEEVRLTLEAATADPTAATAVRSGRLVRSLRYAGFGELPDLAGAVGLAPATPAPAGSAKPTSRRTRDSAEAESAAREEAERAAHEAAGAADDAQRGYEQRLAEEADAEATLEAATAGVGDAARRLADARERKKSTAAAAAKAREAARAAHGAADAARRRLAGLRAEPKVKRRQ